MPRTMLTLDRLREVLSYDPQTGVFTWKVCRNQHPVGRVAGSPNDKGHIQIRIDGQKLYAHRLAWLYMYGEWPAEGLELDHINCDMKDNRISNLRAVSHSHNLQNLKHALSNNKSGMLGVSRSRRGFIARIRVEGEAQSRYLGYFKSADTAHVAYLRAKRELHAGGTL